MPAVVLVAFLFGCAGRAPLNVYQPATSTPQDCPLIEYRWEGQRGRETATYAGAGDFCVQVGAKDGTLEARCVDADGVEVVSWIAATVSSEPQTYCPEVAP